MSGNVCRFFGKNKRSNHSSQRLIVSGALPDFSDNAHQGCRTFQKKFAKVIGLFKNCPATLSNFSEKVR
jgi:hypothetical protein